MEYQFNHSKDTHSPAVNPFCAMTDASMNTKGSLGSSQSSEAQHYRNEAEHTSNMQSRYLDNLKADALELKYDENEVSKYAHSIENLESQEAYASNHEVTSYTSKPWYFLWETNYHHTTHESMIQAAAKDKKEIAKQKVSLEHYESLVSSLAPQGENEIETLNEILGFSSAGGNSSIAEALTEQTVERNNQQVSSENVLVSTILSALNNVIDMKERDLKLRETSSNGHTSSVNAQETYLKNFAASQSNLNLLNSVQSELLTSIVGLHKAYEASKYDLTKHDTLLYNIFKWVPIVEEFSDNHDAEDKVNMAKDLAQIQRLSKAAEMVSSLIGSLESNHNFAEITIELRSILKQMEKVLENPKSIGALLNGVLSLMVQALAIFNMLEEKSEQQKVENKQKMGHANMKLAVQTLQNTLANQKIFAIDEKRLKNSKGLEKILELAMVAAALMSGSVFFIVFTIASTVLQQNGDMAKWQKSLEQKYGKVDGDLIMAGIQLGIGAAGALAEAGVTLAMTNVAEEAAEQVIAQSSTQIEQIAQDAAKQVSKETLEQASRETTIQALKDLETQINVLEKDTKPTAIIKGELLKSEREALENKLSNGIKTSLEEAAENSARDAAMEDIRNAVKEAVQRTIDVISSDTAKMSIPATVSKALEGSLIKATAKAAAKDAVEAFVEESKNLLENGPISSRNIENIITRASARAIAKNTSMDEEEAIARVEKRKIWDPERLSSLKSRLLSARSPALRRALFFTTYAAANSNLLVDGIAAIMKKEGKKESESLKIFMQIMQSLLEMIGMMGSMGFSDASVKGKAYGLFNQATTGAQAIDQVTEGFNQMNLAGVYTNQAKTLETITKEKTFQTLLKAVLDDLESSDQANQKAALERWVENVKALNKLATTVQSDEDAGIQVLMQQTV